MEMKGFHFSDGKQSMSSGGSVPSPHTYRWDVRRTCAPWERNVVHPSCLYKMTWVFMSRTCSLQSKYSYLSAWSWLSFWVWASVCIRPVLCGKCMKLLVHRVSEVGIGVCFCSCEGGTSEDHWINVYGPEEGVLMSKYIRLLRLLRH